MGILKRFVALLTASAAALTMLSFRSYAEEPKETGMGFIHAFGRTLYDDKGKEFIIKGMAFGNDVWSNPTSPPRFHHSEASYKELSQLGFNSVRFYLNYSLFESDEKPYEYRSTGFDWLDTNIKWAGKYGIRLVLNMHYPQGGYQSQGNGTLLWTDSENQKRLKALWTEIARRYADEPVILGYGLVNEPVPVGKTNVDEALDMWKTLSNDITASIREYDSRHLIFIEKANPKPYPGGETDWNVSLERSLPLQNSTNIVYEFHTYHPFLYTHQQFDWAGTVGEEHKYPDAGTGKAKLEESFRSIINFSEQNNVPIYCGEFGAGRHCFENGRGGAQWVSDMLDIFIGNRISFNYHTFNEYSFGFYYPDYSNGGLTRRNEELAAVFRRKLNTEQTPRYEIVDILFALLSCIKMQ